MLEYIKSRRSIRKFTSESIDDDTLLNIIEMGTWAPSGLNNQPWKFIIIRNKKTLDEIANLTKYSYIIQSAPVCIAVFLDLSATYNREKDIQSIGACIQNMLLTIHYKGLGGVWLGEILKNRHQVEKILSVTKNLELMAVIAFGHPDETKDYGIRKPAEDFIIDRKQ